MKSISAVKKNIKNRVKKIFMSSLVFSTKVYLPILQQIYKNLVEICCFLHFEYINNRNIEIPHLQRSHRYPGCFKTLRCRTEFFRNSFIPFTVNEWNKLDSVIKNSDSYEMFRKKRLAFIRPVGNSMYGIYDPFGFKLINRLRLDFSHLREHKFRYCELVMLMHS